MLKPIEQPQSPYKKRLKQIARIAQYQPVASIPQPSKDFNYTISRNRYSQYYETPKIIKKQPVNKSDNLKLTTILETHGGSPLFPKISKTKPTQGQTLQSNRGKVKGLRSHFKREEETTVASRDRSLTIDTRLQSEQDKKNGEESELLESVESKRNKANNSQIQQRNVNCYSNNSQLSSVIYRRNLSHSKQNKSQYIYPQAILNEEDSEDEEEYEKDAIPGPGSYQYSYSDFDKKRTTASTNVSFLSKLTRFNYTNLEKKYEQPLPRNPLEIQKQIKRQQRLKISRKKLVPFNSKSPRSFQFQAKLNQKIPGPQQYYIRQGMEEDLIRVIQRQFKGNFGSQQPRFCENKTDAHLGPGCYEKPLEQDLLSGENYYFKSKKHRFDK